jgi:glycolate oxidase subunit GlcD
VAFLEALAPIVGPEGILTSAEDLACYASDASFAQPEGRPLAVLLPRTTAEVSAVLRLTAQAGWPVVARGAGSGLAGGAIPAGNAVILALTRLQSCTIEPTQALAKVEAGVTTAELQRQAETYGLFYPPDPSSQSVATIGGNLACNAGGPRCLKYGVTSDYVLGLTAVLADGSILKLGDGLAAQGFDAGWVQLLVGSEGTLAIFTEATLRLLPKPAAKQTTLALFPTLAAACTTVETIMAAGLRPASLELMDAVTIEVVEAYLHLGLPQDAGALLLVLNDGEPETVAWETAQVTTFLQQGGAQTIKVAGSPKDEALLWQARRAIGPALARKRPNRLGEDICVPLPQIAQTVQEIGGIARQFALPIPVFGHAGDGNLHPNILFDARNPAEVQRAWQAAEAIFALALRVGGTLSGEHGIGTLKRPFLAQALGPELLALHHTIKKTFDPQGRLNPGKLFP